MNVQAERDIYVLGDGDRIRERVEYHLFKNEMELLTKLSESLVDAIDKVKSMAISTMDAHIIIAGGDDILFCVSSEKYQKANIQKMSEIFYDIVGSTISFGIGKSIDAAYINLRKGKAFTNNKIVEETFAQ
jgi:hypothetical protein